MSPLVAAAICPIVRASWTSWSSFITQCDYRKNCYKPQVLYRGGFSVFACILFLKGSWALHLHDFSEVLNFNFVCRFVYMQSEDVIDHTLSLFFELASGLVDTHTHTYRETLRCRIICSLFYSHTFIADIWPENCFWSWILWNLLLQIIL